MSDHNSRQLLLAARALTGDWLQARLGHDLRAPLNALHITLELLADSVSGDAADRQPRQTRYVAVLKEELGRLERLLLPAAAPPPGGDRVCLERLLADFCDFMARRHCRPELRLPAGGLTVRGDAAALWPALLDLASHRLEVGDGKALSLSVETGRDSAAVVLEDDAAPLAPETLQALNDPTRTDAEPEALRLWAARERIHACGGSFRVVPRQRAAGLRWELGFARLPDASAGTKLP